MTKISLAQTSVPSPSSRQTNQSRPTFTSKKENAIAEKKQDKDNQILSLTLVVMSLVNMIKGLKNENQELKVQNKTLKEENRELKQEPHHLDLAA